MANRVFLYLVPGELGPQGRFPEYDEAIAAASNCLPLFWLTCFSLDSLHLMPWLEDHDGGAVTDAGWACGLPMLMSSLTQARALSEVRLETFVKVFGSRARPLCAR